MELLILDKEFNNSNTLDIFESLIWTDRYFECGDFELYMPANSEILKMLPQGYYLYLKESEHIMIVEDVEIETDTEEGAHLKITGRSLESLLDRRIIWGQKVLSGNLQEGVKTLLNENVISPSDANRKINNFIFRDSIDPNVTQLNLDAQYYGDNLYDAIVDICKSSGIGFKITLEDKTMVFSLYCGIDHSYTQIVHPYVIFSPGFDNLMNSNYIESIKTLKNVTLVAGEGEGSERKTTTVYSDSTQPSGFDRRELFTDASGISQKTEDGDLTDAEYLSQLSQKGTEELSNNKETKSFEGELDISATYTYDEDYSLGDIVQAENEFGNEARCRITEFIRSQDENGTDFYPTFETTEQSVMSIPSDYIPVEYIESHGSEYIDTGFKPNQDTRVVCDIQVTAVPIQNDFFGSRTSTDSADEYNFWYNQSKLYCSYGTSKTVEINIAPMSGRLKVDKNKNSTTVNGTTVTNTSGQTFSSPYTMFIYCNNTSGVPYNDTNCFAKLFSFQIYDNGTLVRNFIPVRSIDGEYGLYDIVNSKFYGNAGTGAFTGGGVILPNGYIPVEFIESHGMEYIDAEVIPFQNLLVYAKFSSPEEGYTNGLNQVFFGGRDVNGASYSHSFTIFLRQRNLNDSSARDDFNSHSIALNSKINSPVIISKSQKYTFVDDKLFTHGDATFSSGANLAIFAVNSSWNYQFRSKVRLYEMSISRLISSGWELQRHFVPCKNSYGEYGLYDTVSNEFYGNLGSGQFTSGGNFVLPSGYSQVEYIESHGIEYIDTGVKPNQNTAVLAKFNLTNKESDGFIFGSRTKYESAAFSSVWQVSTDDIRVDYGDSHLQMGAKGMASDIHVFVHNNVYATYNEKYVTFDSKTFTQSRPMSIFALNDGDTNSIISYIHMRLYRFEVYDNHVPVRYFIPCKNPNGEYGLYELIEGKFYGNAGTGAFTGG